MKFIKFYETFNILGRYLFRTLKGGVGKINLKPGYYNLNTRVLNLDFLKTESEPYNDNLPYFGSLILRKKYKIMVVLPTELKYLVFKDDKTGGYYALVGLTCITDSVSISYKIDDKDWTSYEGKFKLYSPAKVSSYANKPGWRLSLILLWDVILPTVPLHVVSGYTLWHSSLTPVHEK